MARLSSKKPTALTANITRNWQLAFIVMIVLAWLTPVVSMLLWMEAGETHPSFQVGYFITWFLVPLLWGAGAMWYVGLKRITSIAQLFRVLFVAAVAFGLFITLSTMESILRFRYYPPIINNPGDSDLLTMYGHELLVAGVGLVLFYGAIAWRRYVRRGR